MKTFSDTALNSALNTESDRLLPSSGFATAVMSAIQEEACVPAPIPFPWTRAVPGFTAYAAVIAVLLAALVSMRRLEQFPQGSHLALQSLTIFTQHPNGTVEALWLGVASLLTFACLTLVSRLAVR